MRQLFVDVWGYVCVYAVSGVEVQQLATVQALSVCCEVLFAAHELAIVAMKGASCAGSF